MKPNWCTFVAEDSIVWYLVSISISSAANPLRNINRAIRIACTLSGTYCSFKSYPSGVTTRIKRWGIPINRLPISLPNFTGFSFSVKKGKKTFFNQSKYELFMN